MMKIQKGFTLIELMIALAVIFILFSLAAPLVKQAVFAFY
jgi:prepilin-type N-terminal cleavage/methylation domain-containing protein